MSLQAVKKKNPTGWMDLLILGLAVAFLRPIEAHAVLKVTQSVGVRVVGQMGLDD